MPGMTEERTISKEEIMTYELIERITNAYAECDGSDSEQIAFNITEAITCGAAEVIYNYMAEMFTDSDSMPLTAQILPEMLAAIESDEI